MQVKLKTIYDKQEDIPEGFGDLYTQKGEKFELTAVEGVKTPADVDRVQSALTKERNDHKIVREKLQLFGDVDPASLPALQEELTEAKAKLDTLTAEGKLDEGKVQTQIDAAIARAVGPINRDKESLTRRLEVATKNIADKEAEIAGVKQEQQQERIRTQIRDAVTLGKFPVLSTAVDDAVVIGEKMFEFVDGKLVTKDDGGMTPGLSPAEWTKDMMERRPHWWAASVGGGSQGGKGGGGMSNKDNPWLADNWNVTEQGRLYKESPEKAAQMAQRAGVKIGAIHPAKNKAAA
jgi:hypothetical protein